MSGAEHGPVLSIAPPEPASPALSPSEKVIEDLVYEHLFDLVDFDRMHQLEEVVTQKLMDLDGRVDVERDDDVSMKACGEAIERAGALVERAWHRLIKDPRRYVDFGSAWEPDDDCPLCRALAEADGAKPDDGTSGPHGIGGLS